ncbi:hypothetical protein VZC37_13760 [Gordonia sp. LSe1-13]|uniref:Secreted protein n=2 Tax=Gordonia TaxID=2053 RepID=A0ABU7MEE4_9ACTN|nr:hypothetical protein [Gordonia sp. LSe1-13]MEE4025420.1 hypothetical protein [Gordonia sp. PKS22-38]
MTFLFALIGIAAIAFLLWRAFGPQLGESEEGGGQPPRRPTKPSGPVGPDDDPDFLRDLDRRTRGTNGSEGEDA